jgi:hypothetical protein
MSLMLCKCHHNHNHNHNHNHHHHHHHIHHDYHDHNKNIITIINEYRISVDVYYQRSDSPDTTLSSAVSSPRSSQEYFPPGRSSTDATLPSD